jgi:hypothetical protein
MYFIKRYFEKIDGHPNSEARERMRREGITIAVASYLPDATRIAEGLALQCAAEGNFADSTHFLVCTDLTWQAYTSPTQMARLVAPRMTYVLNNLMALSKGE